MNDATTIDPSLELARRIAGLARERRGADLVLLDIRSLVDYTDFFLLVTGQSSRQNQAIGEHVVKTLKGEKRYAISKAGLDTGSWICLDLGDVVVHVFDPETRARYDLELLWADAPRASLEAAPPVPTAPAPAPQVGVAEGATGAVAPKRRRRVVRQAAIPDADLENAPESERPADDAPLPEPETAPLPLKRPRAASRDVLSGGADAPPKGKEKKKEKQKGKKKEPATRRAPSALSPSSPKSASTGSRRPRASSKVREAKRPKPRNARKPRRRP
jgi:ribosome-associated protein